MFPKNWLQSWSLEGCIKHKDEATNLDGEGRS